MSGWEFFSWSENCKPRSLFPPFLRKPRSLTFLLPASDPSWYLVCSRTACMHCQCGETIYEFPASARMTWSLMSSFLARFLKLFDWFRVIQAKVSMRSVYPEPANTSMAFTGSFPCILVFLACMHLRSSGNFSNFGFVCAATIFEMDPELANHLHSLLDCKLLFKGTKEVL